MPSKPFVRGVELRQRLRQAKSNETISLPLKENDFGEYQGPFIIDKPITLTGHGNKTVLLAKGCPAVFIVSAGVKLKNLELTDSFNTASGTCLVIDQKAQPILENVIGCERTIIMSREHLIDLGDFLPQQQASSYFEVEVSAPSRIKCGENSTKWLRVNPETLPASGKYLLQIMCDAKTLGVDAFAAGSIEIISGSDTKVIWVTVHVLPATPPKLFSGYIALSVGTHHIRFTDGFIIGKNKFPGFPGADTIADRQAIILKEASNNTWVIYQPWQTSTQTLINGLPIAQGQRQLLHEGTIIRVGNIELKVESFTGLGTITVSKVLVDLGSSGSTPIDSGFQVRNVGAGKDKIKIYSTIPWLQVNPTEVDLKKDEAKDVSISLTRGVVNLPPGKIRERNAIYIQGKNETICIDASVEVKSETIIPRCVPDNIKFGLITDWTKASVSLALYNDGTKEWQPTIKTDRDWLKVDPINLVVAPGNRENLTIQFNQKVENLGSPSDQTGMISFEGNGVVHTINVFVRFEIKGAEPVIETPFLDFKEVDDWEISNPCTLIIRNKGKKDWTAIIRTSLNWLDIQGDKVINISSGGQKSILVRVNGNLPVGEHNISDAILIEGDNKKLSVAVKVKLSPPTSNVDLFPRLIDFGRFDDYKLAPTIQVTMRNRGTAEWIGAIRCTLPWLEWYPAGSPRKCAAKSDVSISFRVNNQIVDGLYSIPNALIFEGPGGPYRIPVKAQFEPKPILRALPIDLGEIDGWENAPIITLPIFNDGNKDWENVQVSCGLPWINIYSNNITVKNNSKGEIQIQVNEQLKGLKSGRYDIPDAIILSADGIQLPIGFKLTLPPLNLETTKREVVFELDDDTDVGSLKQNLVVSNIGHRNWSGKIEARVPWLSIEPGTASIKVSGSLDLTIGLTDSVRVLGTGEHFFGSLILFEESSLSFDIRVRIKKKDVVSDLLEFEPSQLDFGKIEESKNKKSTFQILSIYSERDWQAKVNALDGWFKPQQETVSGTAQNFTRLKIDLADDAVNLPEGIHWSELRIALMGGKSLSVPVKIEKVEVTPDLQISPPALEIAWHMSEGETPPQKLAVENRSKKDWKISVDVTYNWLEILTPAAGFTCVANGKIELIARLTEQVQYLKDGKYSQEIILRAGSKYRFPYQVNLVVDRSTYDWDVYPEGITFGSVERNNQWDYHPPEELTIRNKGSQELNLSVILNNKGGQWLTAPGALKVPPHADRKINILLKKDVWKSLKLGKQEGVIEINGAGKPIHLLTTLQLIAEKDASSLSMDESQNQVLPQALRVEPNQVLFSETNPTKWRNVPGQTVKIYNPNSVEWTSGLVICAEWLSVEPKHINIPAYGEGQIEIKLKPSPFIKPGEIREENKVDAVTIRHGNELYSIRVIIGQNVSQPIISTNEPEQPKETQPPPVTKNKPDIPGIQQPKTTLFGPKTTPIEESIETPAILQVKENKPVRTNIIQPKVESTQLDKPIQLSAVSIEIQPQQLNFGQVSDWTKVEAQTLSIGNNSDKSININISSVAWLKTSQVDIICPANGSVEFQVSLLKPRGAFTQPSKGRSWDVHGVVIKIGETTFPIPVYVDTI